MKKVKKMEALGRTILKKTLKELDKSVIHDPSHEHRKYLKYPNKILDLKTSRIRAVEAFNLAKKSL